jgi:hypothetical protein
MSNENKLSQDQIELILRLNTEACARIFEAQHKQALEMARLQLEENKDIRKDTREGFKAFGEFVMSAAPAVAMFFQAAEDKRREHEAAMEQSKQEHEVRMQEMKLKTAEAASGKSSGEDRESWPRHFSVAKKKAKEDREDREDSDSLS